MGKLLQRLQDASRSGVYRVTRDAELVDALQGAPLALHRVALDGAGTKKALLARVAEALAFPSWFGGNWDALEDALKDLSWHEAPGHVVLFSAPPPGAEAEVLLDVLASTAEFWKGEGRPFFAVFVDARGLVPAPELFRAA